MASRGSPAPWCCRPKRATTPGAAGRSALHALLPEHTDGDRHRRQSWPHRPQNARFANTLGTQLKGEGRSILNVVVERDRPKLAGRDCQGGRGAERDRPGRSRSRGPGRALGQFFCAGGRGRRRRSGHHLCARNHRAAHPGKPHQSAAEDGIGRPARRRHRARFQQRAVRHHDGDRLSAQRAQADRPVLPGHHADQAERQPRCGAGAATAGVLAPADAAAAGARPRRGAVRHRHAAQAADRREGHARSRRTGATCGR